MKINNMILILLMVLFTTLFKGCNPSIPTDIKISNPPIIESKPIEPQNRTIVPNNRTDYPYVYNGYLYTKLRIVAIKDIKRIDLEEFGIKYFTITWQTDRYTMGIFTMSDEDFKKIEVELLGGTYAKKSEEQKKKESEKSIIDKIFRR